MVLRQRSSSTHAVARAVPLGLFLLSSAVVGGGQAAPAPTEDARIGRRLADAVIASARTYAQAGRRDWVVCGAPGGAGEGGGGAGAAGATQTICDAEQVVASAIAQAAVLREEERRAGAEDAGTTEAASYSW